MKKEKEKVLKNQPQIIHRNSTKPSFDHIAKVIRKGLAGKDEKSLNKQLFRKLGILPRIFKSNISAAQKIERKEFIYNRGARPSTRRGPNIRLQVYLGPQSVQ